MIASAPKWNKLDDVERIVVLSSVSHGLFGGIEGLLLSYLFDLPFDILSRPKTLSSALRYSRLCRNQATQASPDGVIFPYLGRLIRRYHDRGNSNSEEYR
jgi:hypothetical protein